ncbi:MAG TPA: branched-chain amino acid ABC transporter permease [Nitrososphaerales archaeon]|nr:branched-chain amino acid ABC transporter permease [Nitrososphaerales archaeon]
MASFPFELAQAILNGVFQGGFFALAAAGLSLIYGVQKILNIAHGALMVLAAFITIQFSILLTPRLHIDPLLSLPLDFVIMAFVGMVAYFALIYKTENKGFEGPLLATFGLSVFLEYIISSGLVIPFASHPLTLIPSIDPSYGNGAQAENQHYTGSSLFVGGLYIQEPQLIAFVIAIAIIPALQLFLSRTYYGNAIRATAQDWEAAEFSGINILRARLLAFSIGAGLAGVAGGMYAFTNTITATEADTSLLPIVLAIIILGGVGSILGTLFGGLIVGLIISLSDFLALSVLTQYNFPADFGLLLTYIIFLAVMMVKPTGLLGRLGK